MTDFATLPELIVLNILKYLRYTHESTILDIHYCAICHTWRQLALPVAFGEVYIKWQRPLPGSNNAVTDTGWKSNIGKYTTLTQQQMVKKFTIYVTPDSYDFALLLGSMLEEINQGPVGWPEWNEYRIAGGITGEYRLVLEYVHQSLDNKLIGIMRQVLEMFAGKFPNIMWLKVDLRNSRGTARQFTNQLLGIFYHKILKLFLRLEFPLDVEYFPPDLKHLYITFSPNTTYPLPKFKTPEKLEKLEVVGLFGSHSWLDLINIPAGGSPIVFSRLKSLNLNSFDENYYDMRYGEVLFELPERVESLKNLQLQLPRLTDLTLNIDDKQNELLFNPQVIPSTLRRVYIDIGLKEMLIFRKLPIRSIGHLDLCVDVDGMEEFYLATNWFLGELDNYGNSACIELKGKLKLVDMEKIKWTNVTEVELDKIDTLALMDLISKLPLLKLVDIKRLDYHNDYKTSQQQEDCRMEEFGIGKLKEGEWTFGNFAEFLTFLIGQHQSISILNLPKNVIENLEEMFQSTLWQHVKLKEWPDYSGICNAVKVEDFSDDEDF